MLNMFKRQNCQKTKENSQLISEGFCFEQKAYQTIGTVLITNDRNSMRKKKKCSNILSALQCHHCVTHQL